MVHFFQHAAGGPAVRADSQVRVAGAKQSLRLVSRQAYRNGLAGLDHYPAGDGSPPVTARQDRRLEAGCLRPLREILHHGRLPRATHADAADADDRRFQTARLDSILEPLPSIPRRSRFSASSHSSGLVQAARDAGRNSQILPSSRFQPPLCWLLRDVWLSSSEAPAPRSSRSPG